MKKFFLNAQTIVNDLCCKLNMEEDVEVLLLTKEEFNTIQQLDGTYIYLNIEEICCIYKLQKVLLHEVVHIALSKAFPWRVTQNEDIVEAITEELYKEYFLDHD